MVVIPGGGSLMGTAELAQIRPVPAGQLPFAISRRVWTLQAVLVPLPLLLAWVAFRSGALAPINVTVVKVEERRT